MGIMMKQDNVIYNDCFYQNRKSFEYISFLDVDEVLIPYIQSTVRCNK